MKKFEAQTIRLDEEQVKHSHARFLPIHEINQTLVDFAFDCGYYLDLLQSGDPEGQFAEMLELISNYPDMFVFLRQVYYEYNSEWLVPSIDQEA